MSKIVIYLLIVMAASCSNVERELNNDEIGTSHEGTNDNKTYLFLGYKNDKPVFRPFYGEDWYKLYQLENDNLVVINEYNEDYEPLFINDEVIVFGAWSKQQKRLILNYSSGESENYSVDLKIENLAYGSPGIVYGDNFSTNLSSIDTKNNVKRELSSKGAWPFFSEKGNLFFARNSKIGEAYIDIYKQEDLDIKQEILIAKQIFSEGYIIFPSGEYIACHIPVEGQVTKAIYSIAEEKYHLIKDQELNEENYYPIYDYQRNGILYYKPEGLKTKFIPLPTEFNHVYMPH